jgi:hypothetical protein
VAKTLRIGTISINLVRRLSMFQVVLDQVRPPPLRSPPHRRGRETPMLKRYTGDEIHGFMFGDYRSDEPRWIDGKHMKYETVLGMARQIERLLAALTGIAHCSACPTCTKIADGALAGYRSQPAPAAPTGEGE